MKGTTILCTLLLLFSGGGLLLGAQPASRLADTGQLAADLTIFGEKVNYLSGASIATGDINGDGLDDLIYGVPWAMPDNTCSMAGEVHVFFGHKNRTLGGRAVKNITMWPTYTGTPDLTITGWNSGDMLGTSVATGDVNGDGIQDLIMGAGGYSCLNRAMAGSVFVLFGRTTWPAFYVLRATRADIQVIGASFMDRLGGHKTVVPATHTGQSVGAGDINGDGIDDLICGAPDASYTFGGPPRRVNAGACYVLLGRRNWPQFHVHDLFATQAAVTVYSSMNGAHLGACVVAGDFNGDGIQDIIIGEPDGPAPGGAGAGNTCMFWGRRNWPQFMVFDRRSGRLADLTIQGQRQGDQLGCSLDVGDFNNDAVDDLILGAWQHSALNQTLVNSGIVYVFHGKRNWPPNHVINLSLTLGDLNILGTGQGTWLGYRVQAGDVDGDGIDDMVMSSPGESPNLRNQAGVTYMVRGGRLLPPFFTIIWQNFPPDWKIQGGLANECLGQTLAVGDINGDRIADIIQGGDLTAFNAATTARGKTVTTYGGPFFHTSLPRAGTTMTLVILSPAHANQPYVCAASLGLTGNVGIPISPTRMIPIDAGPVMQLSIMAGFPFSGFSGHLSGAGMATAPAASIPGMRALVGLGIFYSMVIQNPTAPQGIQSIGNRVHTTIIP